LNKRDNLKEVAALFLRLGFTAFGGPAAHIGLMHDEVVRRRKWLNEREFLDFLGTTNLIPGPNSTELAIHIGLARAGWLGLVAAGVLFIAPAMAMVMALAYLYVTYGTLPEAGWILYGIKPVVVGIVTVAILGLARTAVKGILIAAIGGAVILLYLIGVNEIALLFGAGFLAMLLENVPRMWMTRGMRMLIPGALVSLNSEGLAMSSAAVPITVASLAATPFSYTTLFLTFLKIGAVLYGSGYVLLAFLRADFVERLGWITDQQLLDAVAIGQVTPGPLFTTATFVGYLVGSWPGAVLATIGIFLPSFIFVAAVQPLIPRLRGSPWASAFLDGVNVAAVALMAIVTFQLGRAAIVDVLTAALALVSFAVLLRYKLNAVWLIGIGAVLGAVVGFIQVR
jgi:chromate transporter